MDTFDMDNIDYNELYKLHTGHVLYDSDSDSSHSNSSNSSWEKYKPPLYTYEELKANTVLIKPLSEFVSKESEIGLSISCSDGVKKPLETEPHKKKNVQYISDKLEGVQSKDTAEDRNKTDVIRSSSSDSINTSGKFARDSIKPALNIDKSIDDKINEELKPLLHLNFCYICGADLPQVAKAQAHYSSNQHQYNIEAWKTLEFKRHQTNKIDRLSSEKLVQKHVKRTLVSVLDKPAAYETLREKLENLICLDYCYLCQAVLSEAANAQSHYYSNRHKQRLDTWKREELMKLQPVQVENPLETGNLVPKTGEPIHQINIQNESNKIQTRTFERSISGNQSIESRNFKSVTNTLCTICGINVVTGWQDHVKSEAHERCAETLFGNVKTVSNEQLTEQVNPAMEKVLDKPAENKILREKLENLICSDYCYLCQASLSEAANAQSHYYSNRHKQTFDTWKREELRKLQPVQVEKTLEPGNLVPKTGEPIHQINIQNKSDKIQTRTFERSISGNQSIESRNFKSVTNTLCTICGINVVTEWQDHVKSEAHKRCTNTLFGYLKTSSNEQLAEQVYPAMQEGKSLSRELLVQNPKNNTPIKVEEPRKGTQFSQEMNGDVYQKSLDDTAETVNHYQEASHIMNNVFRCHLCQSTWPSKTRLGYHANSFPHNEVAKLMSLTVSQGIPTRNLFWKWNEWKIMCTLCGVRIQSESCAADHFGSKRHIYSFDAWCSEQKKDWKDADRRWFYCDICKIPLDGTTNVELHYKSPTHAMHQNSSTNTLQAISKGTDSTILETEPRHEEKLDGASNHEDIRQSNEIGKLINVDKVGIMNNSSRSLSNTGYEIKTKENRQMVALRNEDIQVSTITIEDNNSKIPTEIKSNDLQKLTEGPYKMTVLKHGDIHVATKITAEVSSKISTQTRSQEWQDIMKERCKMATLKYEDIPVNTAIATIGSYYRKIITVTSPTQQEQSKGNPKIAKLNNKETQMSKNEAFVDDQNNLYCYICKKDFNLQIELSAHSTTYPHIQFAKLKSLAVSKGVSAEFWEHRQFSVWCSLCKINIFSESLGKFHFASTGHVFNFNRWCQSQLKNTEISDQKWYFCDVCNAFLDGTSNAEHHYKEKTHAENEKTSTNNLQTSTTTGAINISKTDTSVVKTNTDKKKNLDQLSSIEGSANKDEETKDLHIMVETETNKLTNILNRIPANQALNFLQKYIEELENFSKIN